MIVPVSSGGKQSGSATFKPNATCGRSNSLNSRSAADLNSGGIKVGGSLKRSSQSSKPASHPARPALRLCSSRSFSSLHTSSLTAVPFMRSSRSLNRLDQRSARDGDYIHLYFMILSNPNQGIFLFTVFSNHDTMIHFCYAPCFSKQ